MAIPMHEDRNQLPPDVIDFHRAIESITEELEAVTWYNQRAAVCADPDLKAVLEHNRNEEIEHACMLMEWLRRNNPKFNEELSTYLFKSMPITQIEEAMEGGDDSEGEAEAGGSSSGGSLNIGSLKKG